MEIDRRNRPDIHKINDIRIVKPEMINLDNGIPVYIINTGDLEVNKIDLIVEGGRCDEENQLESDFTAALLRDGTEQHSAIEIANALDFYGAWLGSNNTAHNITTSMYSINKYFDKVIPLFSELVRIPSFNANEVENLKNRAKTRFHTNNEKVSYLATTEFQSAYYGNTHNLGLKISDESIDKLQREDLRKFHGRTFNSHNAKIIISGAVNDKIINILNESLGYCWGNGEKITSASDAPTTEFVPATISIDKPGALQSAIKIGIPTILRSHPDYIKLRILTTALGGYFGSRLMQNIREEKGYTYGISSSLIGMRNNSCITIASQCDNAYTRPLVEEIKKEIMKLKQEPMSDAELQRVKSFMLSDLAKTTETPFSIAEFYSAIITNNIPDNYFENQKDTVISITAQELQDIAIKYLDTEKMLTVIAGDSNAINKL